MWMLKYIQADNILLSPGEDLPEKDFVKKATDRNKYLLPHYSIGLLLSRNVTVEFSELSSSAVYHAIQQSSSFSAGFSVGFWASGSASGSWGSSSTHTKVEASETGMRVAIPGAQVIGYYTQNVPLFPKP